MDVGRDYISKETGKQSHGVLQPIEARYTRTLCVLLWYIANNLKYKLYTIQFALHNELLFE